MIKPEAENKFILTEEQNNISKVQDISVISLAQEEALRGAKICSSCHHLALMQRCFTGKHTQGLFYGCVR